MKHVAYILSLFFIFLSSCAEEGKPQIDVYEIRNIGVLSTTEFTIGKIVKLNDDKEWYKFGDRKILISTHAKIKAGVNLMDIRKEDIQVNGNNIKIILPAAEITSFEMNPEDIKTEMVDVNGFRSNFTQEDKNKLLRLGEESIRKEVYKTNILKEAMNNTEAFVTNFYKDLGYEKVDVEFKKPADEK